MVELEAELDELDAAPPEVEPDEEPEDEPVDDPEDEPEELPAGVVPAVVAGAAVVLGLNGPVTKFHTPFTTFFTALIIPFTKDPTPFAMFEIKPRSRALLSTKLVSNGLALQ